VLLPLVVRLLRRVARGRCGAAGLLIYNVLGDEPQTRRLIQQRTLLPQQTVSRKLGLLLDRDWQTRAQTAGHEVRPNKHAASSKVQGHYDRDTARAERERAAYSNNKLKQVHAARRKEVLQRKAEVRRILREERLPNYGYLGFYLLDEHRLVDSVTGEIIEVSTPAGQAVA
jgi:hypothetical protein